MHAACRPQNDIHMLNGYETSLGRMSASFRRKKTRNPRQPASGKPESMGLGEGQRKHKFVA